MRAMKRSLKQLGDPDTSLSEADQLQHTRECLLNIGKHINDVLMSFTDRDKINEWRRYTAVAVVVVVVDGGGVVVVVVAAAAAAAGCRQQQEVAAIGSSSSSSRNGGCGVLRDYPMS